MGVSETSPEVIPVDDTEIVKEGWQIHRPSSPLTYIFAMELKVLITIAERVRSEDLKEYVRSVVLGEKDDE